MEYYTRLEPNDACRDVLPTIPDLPDSHRLCFSGIASDQVWTVLYTNPSPEALLQLHGIVQRAIDAAALVGSTDILAIRGHEHLQD